MKDFPRLHSLHTVNIRHHQNADYLFHQLRTDFIGESGAGKSIIADLLQLIFIGSREYRSATQSLDDERKPKTLLLPSELLGYAFLNLETSEGEYVVVGVQIEDVHHGVRLFVIQQGFDLDELSRLMPFTDPITVKDILLDNDVLPLSELAVHLEKKGLLVKQYPSTKAYHALLYRSELLPFDLASSEQSLKTYAKIIQAFSRRKSLDPKKSKELIEFLFGNDKGLENYRQYEDLMRSVERDDDDYRLNRAEVEQIKEKEAALQALRTTQKRFLEAKHIYNLALLQDAYERRRLTKQKLYKAFEDYTTSARTMEHWQTYCQEQHSDFEKQETPLLLAEQEALAIYTEKHQPFKHIQKVDEWLKRWGGVAESLPQHFRQYKEAKNIREAYQKLGKVFTDKQQWAEFEQSGWANGWETGHSWSEKKLIELEKSIQDAEDLRDFKDVNDSLTLVEQYIREHVNDFVKPIWEAPQTDFPFTINYQSARTALRIGQQYMLPGEDWDNLFKTCEQAQRHYDAIANRYENLYGKLPSLPIEQELGGVEQCQSSYTKAESQYESEYWRVAEKFLGNYAVELENTYDYLVLVNYLFPKLLDNSTANEEDALIRITQRLTEVLNHIRNLNKRRLNQISEVLGGVAEDWRELGNNLRKIGRFFEDSKHHITGGHRVKLTLTDSITYPIKWIYEFRRKLAISHEFADQFISQITFKEKIIAAYIECSNVRKNDLDIYDLLNPNSYLNLDFSIVSIQDSTKSNDGSTGQTYAAIALLCIARLSLIGRVRRKGIRFMPIDEAEGLGSNYDMLYDIARNNDYQLISMSINLVGSFKEGNQYVHMLQRDLNLPEPINYTPYSIFSQSDLDELLDNTDSDVWHDDVDTTDETDRDSVASEDINSSEATERTEFDNDSDEDQEEDEEEPTA